MLWAGEKIHLFTAPNAALTVRIGEDIYCTYAGAGLLSQYIQTTDHKQNNRIFTISYVAAWSMVKKAGQLVGIELKPHDLRRHAATYASRSGTPIGTVSKVNDTEAIRWIETLYG